MRKRAVPGAGPPPGAWLLGRLRAAPYAALALGVLAVAAYLCLVNLDYAALWHDEAPAALIGRNLLQRGDITGWDGRNLVGGTNGRTLNAELRDVLPPLTYVLNAAGMAVFGVNETGARIMPALLGIVTLGLLYLLLRQHLAEHPRLIFFCLLFAAWSPQLLLYFRQSRYYAFMACSLIAAFYFYERWWRSGKTADLCALTLVALCAFFNHYNGGAATMLALAAWHLILRRRATTLRQWLELAICGLVVVALGTGYLAWLGVIGGERSGFLAYTGIPGIAEYRGTVPPFVLRIGLYTRDLFTADWVSWPVLLWFVGLLLFIFLGDRRRVPPARQERRADRNDRPRRSSRSRGEAAAAQGRQEPPGGELPLVAAGGIVLMGALFALFAAALSVQPIWTLKEPYTDLRYYMGALPLLLAMKGLFAEWAWRRSRIVAAAAAAVLLVSSAGAWPFNILSLHTREPALGLHLLQFVREIHRPYRDSIRVASDYLLEHAAQDDLVYVPGFADREALTFTTGHRVLFCCVLGEDSPLPPATVESLDARLFIAGGTPDWIVLFGKLSEEYWDKVRPQYDVAARPDVFFYPTQRPEINMHAFMPLPLRNQLGVHILQRKPGDKLYQAAAALLRQQRYAEALATYREVLEIDPEHIRAKAAVGQTLFALERYEEALEALRAAAALPPDPSLAGRLQGLMGRAALELGRAAAAAHHFERALQLDPRNAEVLDYLALVRFRQERYETALDLYRRLVEVSPDNAQAHANMGAALYYLGRLDEAARSFEQALALAPGLATARSGLEGIQKSLAREAP